MREILRVDLSIKKAENIQYNLILGNYYITARKYLLTNQ